MKLAKAALVLCAASAVVLSGCSSSGSTAASSAAPASAPASAAAEGDAAPADNAGMKLCMYTHGDGGSFWSVAKKGAEKAAADLGVTLDYQESNNDPEAQAQMIEAGTSAGCMGMAVSAPNADAIKDAAMRLMATINEADSPVHPTDPSIRGCKHVQVLAPGSTAQHSRHAMVISPGWFDRSPCGTGTSARMAQLHARGELPLDTDFINESFIGTHFVGRLVEETRVGDFPAVVPTITGRAWITATAQYVLSDDDPFPAGFLL